MDRARALWARISGRLDQLRLDLDRVLVVGVVGGTGTGKSTLLNALAGQRVCPAGDVERPTTRRPVVLAHPDIDVSQLEFNGAQPEVHRLALPMLQQMILIDCPDPDTQSRNGSEPRQRPPRMATIKTWNSCAASCRSATCCCAPAPLKNTKPKR